MLKVQFISQLPDLGDLFSLSQIASIMPNFYTLPFIKMQGLGNDHIFLDGEALLHSAARPLLSQWQAIVPELARQLCHRRLSIGGDGLILAMPLYVPELAHLAANLYGASSKGCDLSWTYHNSDGSFSDMCGNGLRCMSLWAKEEKNMGKQLKIATAVGPLTLDYENENNITAAFGAPKLKANEIPFVSSLSEKGETSNIIREQFKLKEETFPITCVNVGNPHCVIFEANFLKADLFISLRKANNVPKDNFFPAELIPIAEALEVDKRFPEYTNIEFVNVVDRNHIQVLVWERGSKATLACGSAAAAAAVASILEKRTDRKVYVTLPGGTLLLDWTDENVIKMTGQAKFSFRGEVNISANQLKSESKKDVSIKVPVL